MQPRETPIGLQLTHSSKVVSRAFGDALAAVGGSVPMWLILTRLRGREWPAQLELARSVGIEGPTLTRHLDGLERAGLVVRRRDPENRRAVRVELTKAGEARHDELREAVVAFDRRLRSSLTTDDLAQLRRLLGKLEANVSSAEEVRSA